MALSDTEIQGSMSGEARLMGELEVLVKSSETLDSRSSSTQPQVCNHIMRLWV